MNSTVSLIMPAVILLSGVIDDLRSQKFHNALFLTLLPIAAIFQWYVGGWPYLSAGGFGALTAFMICLPLVALRAIGAGDLKLMVVFGLSTSWQPVLNVVVWSLLWGAILGLFRATLNGQIKSLLFSTYFLVAHRTPQKNSPHKIPFTIALTLGWLTYLSLAKLPGGTL